jgi:uncharacterized protein (DUF885 family)
MAPRHKRLLGTLGVLLLVSLCALGCNSNPTSPPPTQPATALPTANAELPATSPPATQSPALPTANAPASPATPAPTSPPTSPPLAADSPAAALAAELAGLDLDAFFDVSFRALMMRNPEGVLTEGLADAWGLEGAQLTDISDAYTRETLDLYAVVLDTLHTYDRESLMPEQQISYDVYEWYLDDELRRRDFFYDDYPATYYFVTSVPEQLLQFFTDFHPLADRQDAEDYVTRLGQVDEKFAQLIDGLKRREEAGIVPPKFAIQWALYNWRSLANAPASSTPYYQAFEEKLGAVPGLSDGDRTDLLARAELAIDESVLPAYRDLVAYLQHQEAIATSDDGVWKLPDGEAYYTYLLRHFTTTDLSADEIHELGLAELDRIHAEMRTIFDELGYPQGESLAALFNRVAADSGQVSGNQVVETYETLIQDADSKLDAVFDLRPKADVIVIAAPIGGYYVSGSRDGSRPGAFYAGVSGAGEDRYAMPTLAYHEAIPGHHWQIAIAQELDLPAFRTALGFTAYTEGWALYAERLAWELGWYDGDPYGNLGRLQAEAFRAARLVVDTGIHAQHWTFDQAEDFMVENVGYERGDNVNPQYEVARYIVWPGQSTAYKIGMIEILALRQRAMDQLGDKFDLKEFHNVLLSNGAMPLEILERVVDDYIAAKLAP